MSANQSLEIVKNYFKAFNEGRTKDMLTLLHPEIDTKSLPAARGQKYVVPAGSFLEN